MGAWPSSAMRKARGRLSNSSLIQFLHSPKRAVRQTAFHQYYEQFSAHKNTLAATLSGSIQKDIYYANARVIELLMVASGWYLIVVTVLTLGQMVLERRFSRGRETRRMKRVAAEAPA